MHNIGYTSFLSYFNQFSQFFFFSFLQAIFRKRWETVNMCYCYRLQGIFEVHWTCGEDEAKRIDSRWTALTYLEPILFLTIIVKNFFRNFFTIVVTKCSRNFLTILRTKLSRNLTPCIMCCLCLKVIWHVRQWLKISLIKICLHLKLEHFFFLFNVILSVYFI